MKTFKSRFTIFAMWFLPEWFVRWLPPSFHEAVERHVYDGLTRHEWVEEQVRQVHAGHRARQAPRAEQTKGDG